MILVMMSIWNFDGDDDNVDGDKDSHDDDDDGDDDDGGDDDDDGGGDDDDDGNTPQWAVELIGLRDEILPHWRSILEMKIPPSTSLTIINLVLFRM